MERITRPGTALSVTEGDFLQLQPAVKRHTIPLVLLAAVLADEVRDILHDRCHGRRDER